MSGCTASFGWKCRTPPTLPGSEPRAPPSGARALASLAATVGPAALGRCSSGLSSSSSNRPPAACRAGGRPLVPFHSKPDPEDAHPEDLRSALPCRWASEGNLPGAGTHRQATGSNPRGHQTTGEVTLEVVSGC